MVNSHSDGINTLADALDSITEWVSKYTVLPDAYTAPTLALWVAHTHVSTAFYTTPRIVASSPVAGSGKTRLLELIAGVAYMPKQTVNSSTAAIYRRINKALADDGLPPTLLYDEADALFGPRPTPQSEDMRALLNAGYKAGATVDRCEGDSHDVVEFPVFAPVALAGLAGHMPDTITTRAITIEMKKRRRGEKITPYRERTAYAEMAGVREFLTAWSRRAHDDMKTTEATMPHGVEDRPAEVWEPLVIIADAAGGHWPATARDACRSFVFAPEKRPPSTGVELLSDIRKVMGHDPDDDTALVPVDTIRTSELVEKLNKMTESGWRDVDSGRGVSPRFLSRILSGYDVRPVSIRDSLGSGKGYTTGVTYKHGKPFQSGFFDAWGRYLPTPSISEIGDNGDSSDVAGQTPQTLSPFAESVGDTSVTSSATGDKKVTENKPLNSTVTSVTDVTDFSNSGEGKTTEVPHPDDDIVTLIVNAATDAGGSGVGHGVIGKLVREATGDGSRALAVADEMVAAGLLDVDDQNRYYMKETA
ncbi:DUF3631 domain-containing protein [Corynebacterium glyciniphilum]|uniref:DUF3631 domain-containing protein n=1 Tax=Corynebacterium glyciniphilum TaxID=1404244 RepID=UPI002654C6AD|nr:DUF3631 domain-containing protein [Corynebacterium glyciniphilum]MDN6707407.1 DUF3631 domain-containing protein [Corynebacterium glyciniphilum]